MRGNHNGGVRLGRQSSMGSLDYECYDARKFAIGDLLRERGNKIVFAYDFGDGWKHTITRMAKPKFDTP